jgi:hypothetical protein
MKTAKFPVGTRDTLQGVQTCRQARRTLFHQLDALFPEAMTDLRRLPFHKRAGEIVNTANARLPRYAGGQWIDTGALSLPPAVADELHALVNAPSFDRNEIKAKQIPKGWSAFDIGMYLDEAGHLFVPKSVIDWEKRLQLESRCHWVAAFGTLVRARWRTQPKQTLEQVLKTLGGFPILHPHSAVTALRLGPERLPEYPTLSPADPRAETQKHFIGRARAHYQEVSKHLEERGLKPVGERELNLHASWLIRCQVKGESQLDIAEEQCVSRENVNMAIHKIADITGITLPRRSGRPPGLRESRPRLHRS